MAKITRGVTGMTCSHCVAAVTEELTALAGVEGVTVHLVPQGTSLVEIEISEDLPDAAIAEAIAEAGYDVVEC
jgi:copper chaperone